MPGTLLQSTVDELAAQSATTPFDCVVAGGGSSGLTAARTLAEQGLKVCVLEAGPLASLTHILNTGLRFSRQLSDNIRNAMQYGPTLPGGEIFGPNFSCVGGRGMFWSGSAPRYRAHDFNGWPISLSDLQSDYAWAETQFRVTRLLGESPLASRIIAQLREQGVAAEPGPFAADVGAIPPGTLSEGIASGLGVFLRGAGQFVAAGAIRVASGACATRVLLTLGVARGVLARQGQDGAPKEILARSVVLAGGGIESVRLAALSETPDRSGRIGIGLQDHIFYRAFLEGPQVYDPNAAEWAAIHVPSLNQDSEQWEIHAPGRRLFSVNDGTPWAPAPGDAYWLMMRSFASTEKRDENYVEPREGPLGSAVIHFDYSPRDDARKGSMRAQGTAIAAALEMTLREERIAAPGSSYHEAGGLDMGSDPLISVTNTEGSFHGVPNLVCVDAAAFPRIGATNPHLTLVAMARRQSNRLASRLIASA